MLRVWKEINRPAKLLWIMYVFQNCWTENVCSITTLNDYDSLLYTHFYVNSLIYIRQAFRNIKCDHTVITWRSLDSPWPITNVETSWKRRRMRIAASPGASGAKTISNWETGSGSCEHGSVPCSWDNTRTSAPLSSTCTIPVFTACSVHATSLRMESACFSHNLRFLPTIIFWPVFRTPKSAAYCILEVERPTIVTLNSLSNTITVNLNWKYSETCIRRNLNKAESCSMWTNSIVPASRISVIYFV
jgi:hypothetical protein